MFLLGSPRKETSSSIMERGWDRWSLSYLARDEPLGRADQELAAALCQRAEALPLIQQTTSRENGDVRSVRQLLISDIQFNPLPRGMADGMSKGDQNFSQSLSRIATCQSYVRGDIDSQVIREDGQNVIYQSWISLPEAPDRVPPPNQDGPILDDFCPNNVGSGFRQNRRTAEDLPRH